MRFLRTPDDRFDRIVMANGALPDPRKMKRLMAVTLA